MSSPDNPRFLNGLDRSAVQSDAPRPRSDRLYVGKLLEHGRAAHEFHRNGHPSYYVKLLHDGQTQLIWARGLEAAFTQSRTHPKEGDFIGVRENNLDPVSVVTRTRNGEGLVTATRQLDTPRPHWVVEKLEEFDLREAGARALRDPTISRREAVVNHRDLMGFYWVLDAGQKIAEAKIREPERQQAFMKLLRETLATAYVRGEAAPIPPAARAANVNAAHGQMSGKAVDRTQDRARE